MQLNRLNSTPAAHVENLFRGMVHENADGFDAGWQAFHDFGCGFGCDDAWTWAKKVEANRLRAKLSDRQCGR